MSRKKIWSLALLVMLVLSSILAACTSESGDDGSDGENSDPKVLVFGRGGDSVSLDPGAVTDGESFKVTQNLFETLVNFGEEDTTINPGLAKEWDAAEDGLTYTFQLEEGIKFHDGTDFNADAVVANFERWANGSGEDFYYYSSMFGGYAGDEGHVIESVTADGDYTVVFKLKRPQAPFLKNLAMSPFGIASPDAIEKHGDKFGDNPVGTGPFQFVEWKRNDSITIEKFEDYWVKDLPKLD